MARDLILRSIPTVAIRGMAVFPDMQLHFEVSRKQSISALKAAMAGKREWRAMGVWQTYSVIYRMWFNKNTKYIQKS